MIFPSKKRAISGVSDVRLSPYKQLNSNCKRERSLLPSFSGCQSPSRAMRSAVRAPIVFWCT